MVCYGAIRMEAINNHGYICLLNKTSQLYDFIQIFALCRMLTDDLDPSVTKISIRQFARSTVCLKNQQMEVFRCRHHLL